MLILLRFAGTDLYVKSVTRERGNLGYRWASGVHHCLPVVAACARVRRAAVASASAGLSGCHSSDQAAG
ncbi:hypothetical protein S1361_05140 [Streptomyces cyanogenus]|uniref:Uncharacterized protein n=1 Tax=Streptomyces cyanogenus TaxID=80860 RepID=A0ABX7TJA9_STRCY|nr:hypothetical protein S1361_05140 [Streptomyces cyanogenus]